jgi:prophage antirepressor-like protein
MLHLRRFNYHDEDGTDAELQTVEINKEIWFVAAAVCKILAIQNTSMAVASLEDDERMTYTLYRASKMREVNLVNESGLYTLIFKSRKPSARLFRQWVTKEVLPAIRREGFYGKVDGTGLPNFITRYKENFDKIEWGHFSVISELFICLYLEFEKLGFIIPERSPDGTLLMPDISVGQAFARYLRHTNSEYYGQHKKYWHTLNEDKEVEANQYPVDALGVFRRFVLDVWLPEYGEKYFRTRAPQALEYIRKLIRAA